MNLILYGPPGAGKTTLGQALAARLGREFADADALIEARAGRPIPEIFAAQGEAGFRRLEAEVCAELAARDGLVVAPGGGALLDPANRRAFERTGLIICLRATPEALLARLAQAGGRPLLEGADPAGRLAALLAARRALYDSFPEQLDTTQQGPAQLVEELVLRLAPRALPVRAPGLTHEIALGYGLAERLPDLLAAHGLRDRLVLVTDANLLAARGGQGAWLADVPTLTVPSGETHKTLDTVRQLYEGFLAHGLDRQSVVVAMGGGVLGDLTGFAAATYMRGVRWVNVPTTLLAMVDASLGGKTGVDLPQGKNLVGAFHPPALVVSDPLTLHTLPAAEWTSGMAEVIKHALLGDAPLFAALTGPAAFGNVGQLARAIQVKVAVVEEDPFERGRRATLNLGHTIGHGVEAASGLQLRHGEAVAIGLWAETWLAERLGLAARGLLDEVAGALARHGLPQRCPGLDPQAIRRLMANDKKNAGGRLKFALPRAVGEAVWGVEVAEPLVAEALALITQP